MISIPWWIVPSLSLQYTCYIRILLGYTKSWKNVLGGPWKSWKIPGISCRQESGNPRIGSKAGGLVFWPTLYIASCIVHLVWCWVQIAGDTGADAQEAVFLQHVDDCVSIGYVLHQQVFCVWRSLQTLLSMLDLDISPLLTSLSTALV